MRSLRARLFAITLAAVLVATVMTVAVGALLVRSRVEALVQANLSR